MSRSNNPHQDPDIFLDEEKLIRLAIQEMRGRRPPEALPEEGGEKFVPPTPPNRDKPSLLVREMQARGWEAKDVADATGLHSAEVNALMNRRARLTKSHAEALARAFATSPEFWLSGG